MTDLLAVLPELGVYAAVLLAIATGACLLCRTRLGDDGTSFDRFLSGERREYRDEP